MITIPASNLRATVGKVLGFGLGNYVNRIRINRAQGLITGTDMSIKEIAYECGFNSSQSFARAFRRATGKAPQQYRESAVAKGSD
jgi:transcriptional regulator GlxA family with amidase domain